MKLKTVRKAKGASLTETDVAATSPGLAFTRCNDKVAKVVLPMVVTAMFGLLLDLSASDELEQAREAAERMVKFETETHEEWFSVSSARAASTAIAEASREKAKRTLADLKKKKDDKRPDADQTADKAEVKTESGQADQLKALRTATDQMITDHEVATRAIEALPPMEKEMWQVIAYTQAALRTVAELEARQAQDLAERTAKDDLAGKAVEKDTAEKARLAWRKMREIDLLTAWKSEMWNRSFQQATAKQMRWMNNKVGKLAKDLAAVETDPDRGKRLKTLIAESSEKEGKAKKKEKEFGDAATAAADKQRVLGNLAWGGLKPLDTSQWDKAKARHLRSGMTVSVMMKSAGEAA